MTTPDNGFVVLRRPAVLAHAFDSSPLALDAREYMLELRAMLPAVRPEFYRGIQRNALNPDLDHRDPGWPWSPESIPERARDEEGEPARRRMAEILNVHGEIWPNEEIHEPWLLPDLSAAQELHALIPSREDCEVVHVARHPTRSMAPSAGFDVGYWASQSFSILCDSAFWPQWHPADSNAFGDLKRVLAPLNEHGLFPDARTAETFREWYRSQSWAETENEYETSRFELIEISLVEGRSV